MDSPKHIIKRQVIEVDVPSVEGAWKIQNQFSELYKYELMHILDEVFSNFSGPDDLLRIDKLEIDLGKINASAFDEEVATKLRSLLEEKISEIKQKAISDESIISPEEKIKNARNVRYTSSDFLVHFLKTGTAPWWYNKENFGTLNAIVGEIISNRPQWIRTRLKPLLAKNEIRARLVSHLGDQRLTEFLHVLAPEFVQDAGKINFLIAEQIRKIKTNPGFNSISFRAIFWNSLLEKIASGKQDSLIKLFSRKEVLKVVRSLAKKEKLISEFMLALDLKEIISVDEKAIKPGTKKSQKRRRKDSIAKNEISDADFANENLSDEEIEMENESELPDNELPDVNHENEQQPETGNTSAEKKTEEQKATSKAVNRNKLKKRDKKNKVKRTGSKNEIATDAESTELIANESVDQFGKTRDGNNEDGNNPDGNSEDGNNEEGNNPEEEVSHFAKEKSNLRVEEAESFEEFETYSINEEDLADFTIENAGLVLLWPYLNPFFTELGLVADKKFIDESASSRAVHLLHYLATGVESDYEEHELVLNKLLCGLDVTTAIEMEFEITAREKEEAESLLQAVITNWGAIGSTSVNGFRGTFILREGALKKDEQGWRLYIDRKAFDILLDRLPWGISIIRLPWNMEIMYVEW